MAAALPSNLTNKGPLMAIVSDNCRSPNPDERPTIGSDEGPQLPDPQENTKTHPKLLTTALP